MEREWKNEAALLLVSSIILLMTVVMLFNSRLRKLFKRCDFCSNLNSNLGIKSLAKTNARFLHELLIEESGFDSNKKKSKQKIGHKLMTHYNKDLIDIFNLVGKHKEFNNLALDKIRTDKGNALHLGIN